MRTLRMDAWDKVVAGVTSVDEVLRVTKGEAL
jgi:general secretion pathway protein E/type IV pilus assembly protein PilB